MGKFFLKFFIVIITLAVLIVIYLSYFGLETDRFDNLIKNKVNSVNKNIALEFKKTKIHLDISELKLVVKLQNPKILVKNNEIDLSRLDTFLSLKSFFSSDFLLKRAEVAFEKNDIKDLIKVTNIFLPRILNKQLNKIFSQGTLEGEIIVPFTVDGNIDKNYGFSGKISNALINLTKEYSIKNLTTEINNGRGIEVDGITTKIKSGFFLDLDLSGTDINLKHIDKETKIKSLLHTNGKLNFSQVKKLSSLLGFKINFLNDINIEADLITDLKFNLNSKFKIQDLTYLVSGDIFNLQLDTNGNSVIKKYLTSIDPNIVFKNTKIKLEKNKTNQNLELSGLIKLNKKFEIFKINNKYNLNKKSFDVKGSFDLTDSTINIARLNYKKDQGTKSDINFDIGFVFNKYYNILDLNYISEKNKIYLSQIKLNKKLEAIDFKKLEFKTFSNNIKNNDFSINKSQNIIISGEIFDAEPILNSLYKKKKRKTFDKNFKGQIEAKINKALTGTNDNISNLVMIASVKNGSYEKLNLKGDFSKNEIIEMSIDQISKEKKVLNVISDRAKPFVKNFKFIKGFEGGKLDYKSEISKKSSEANLVITNFKVSKVPVLAQLLTLASLQGIANTLSGEGIDFDTYEMKFNTEGNILNIDEAYASGPAVSILLDGYVDKGKTVSLRGTLVPAAWLNSIINKIPIVGKILVGEKSGEGVVGVSFKMKGPPKNIKTTVNPLKTLTPRFIIRAIEKMKKNKKEKTK